MRSGAHITRFSLLLVLTAFVLACSENVGLTPQPRVTFFQVKHRLSASRSEVLLSAGDVNNSFANRYLAISDTLRIFSNTKWSLINGSPSLFTVESLTTQSDTTTLVISALTNNPEPTIRTGKIILVANGLDPLEIQVRQEASIPLYGLAGTAVQAHQDGPFSEARFGFITSMSFDAARQTLFLADGFSVRKLELNTQTVSTLPGIFHNLWGLCSDPYGEVFVGGSSMVFQKISPDGIVTPLSWEVGDVGILSTHSDSGGPIYFVNGNRIKRVDPNHNESVLAGAAEAGFADGPSNKARFDFPMGLTVTEDGYVVVGDNRNHRIRVISPDGSVSTLAGNGVLGYRDGAISQAILWEPTGLAVTSDGTLYFIDGGKEVRKITKDRKQVRTVHFINESPTQYYAIHAAGDKVFLSDGTKVYIFYHPL